MPATVMTRETFSKDSCTLADVKAEQALRIKAGAIRSTIETTDDGWTLVTEWNVVGQNDE